MNLRQPNRKLMPTMLTSPQYVVAINGNVPEAVFTLAGWAVSEYVSNQHGRIRQEKFPGF
ncbi:hypothetical protein D3C75_1379920 [compost metagenome]